MYDISVSLKASKFEKNRQNGTGKHCIKTRYTSRFFALQRISIYVSWLLLMQWCRSMYTPGCVCVLGHLFWMWFWYNTPHFWQHYEHTRSDSGCIQRCNRLQIFNQTRQWKIKFQSDFKLLEYTVKCKKTIFECPYVATLFSHLVKDIYYPSGRCTAVGWIVYFFLSTLSIQSIV